MSLDVMSIRKEFPFYSENNGLIYFDHAATTPKPRNVVDLMRQAQVSWNANVHRGIYELSARASERFERVREKTAKYFGADSDDYVVVFTKGTTEAINLIASSIPERELAGKTIAVTRLEHHSNFVPWQWRANQSGLSFEIIEVNSDALANKCEIQINIDEKSQNQVLSQNLGVLAMTASSNVTGTKPDLIKLSKIAKNKGAFVVLDAAQWTPHRELDVRKFPDIDFFCFSAHKMYGPTGLGICIGKRKSFARLNPYQLGGDMILNVGDKETSFADLPSRFEAGTPPFHSVMSFEGSLDFLSSIGLSTLEQHESNLTKLMKQELIKKCPDIRIFSTNDKNSSLVTFLLPSVHPHDLATYLDTYRIAIRAGHHCAQPLHRSLELSASARASVGVTNTEEEVLQFVDTISKAHVFFSRSKQNNRQRDGHL